MIYILFCISGFFYRFSYCVVYLLCFSATLSRQSQVRRRKNVNESQLNAHFGTLDRKKKPKKGERNPLDDGKNCPNKLCQNRSR